MNKIVIGTQSIQAPAGGLLAPVLRRLCIWLVVGSCLAGTSLTASGATFKRKGGDPIVGEVLSITDKGIVFKTSEGRLTGRIPLAELEESEIARDAKVKAFRDAQTAKEKASVSAQAAKEKAILDAQEAEKKMQAEKTPREVRYTDILRRPSLYINQPVIMKGEAYSIDKKVKFFLMMQGPNIIEVHYEQMPLAKQALIPQKDTLPKLDVTVVGIVRRTDYDKNTYKLMASDVVFE